VTGRRLSAPPGRAGRIWLTRRLETARRGASLLDRKLRILQGELDRRRAAAAQAAARWESCQADADRWLLRVSLLSGQRAIRLAGDSQLADVTVTYATAMGIRYPARATCAIPAAVTWDGPVMAQARRAHRAALDAAVQHAAAAAALRILEDETAVTRYRLRAVRDRWIPRLEQALAEVTFEIEELERADAARLRRAVGQTAGSAEVTPTDA
jgi:V/A-type H+/Na+-transporting ATPase subunit D